MAATPFTYDPTTDAGQVRLLAFDNDPAYAVFTDNEIAAFLTMNNSIVGYAAAQALGVLAASRALVMQKLKMLDMDLDGIAVAQEFRAQADALIKSVDHDPFAVDWIENVDEFNYRQRVLGNLLRSGGF